MYNILMVSANALFFDQVMEFNLKNNLHYFFKQSNLSDDILDNIFKENPSAILIHYDKIKTSDFTSILKEVKLNVLGREIPLIVCTSIQCEVDKIDT